MHIGEGCTGPTVQMDVDATLVSLFARNFSQQKEKSLPATNPTPFDNIGTIFFNPIASLQIPKIPTFYPSKLLFPQTSHLNVAKKRQQQQQHSLHSKGPNPYATLQGIVPPQKNGPALPRCPPLIACPTFPTSTVNLSPEKKWKRLVR